MSVDNVNGILLFANRPGAKTITGFTLFKRNPYGLDHSIDLTAEDAEILARLILYRLGKMGKEGLNL